MSTRTSVRRLRLFAAVMLGLLCVTARAVGAPTASVRYVPGMKIALEVRTPQGDLRSFQRPGAPPTYWAQDMPVVQGDKVTITPMVATGGGELGQLKIRLDNEQLADRTTPPWRVGVDSGKLVPGYHLVEVWAATKGGTPPAGGGAQAKSVTTTFLVVPQNDPLLSVLAVGAPTEQPGETGPAVTAVGAPTDEGRLASAIRSLEPKVDEELTGASSAKIAAPTLFYVSAGPAAKEFFYTLSRDGQVTYTSPRLPLITSIMLEPQTAVGAPTAEGQGQAPGVLILTARAGDGEGRFGPPAWVTVHIAVGAPTEAPGEKQ